MELPLGLLAENTKTSGDEKQGCSPVPHPDADYAVPACASTGALRLTRKQKSSQGLDLCLGCS